MRRVVTGLDAAGKSCVIVDGPGLPMGGPADMVWRSAVPADNAPARDCEPTAFDFALMQTGTVFMRMVFEPGMGEFWHATDTIDYVVMLEGEVTLLLAAGEARLKAGDFLVDRGVIHCWRNDGDRPAVAAIVMLPALPLEKVP